MTAVDGSLRPARQGSGRRWLTLLALLAVFAFTAYRSDILRLHTAEVSGNERLTRHRILEAAGVYPGAPRWEHPARQVEARLREEPWVLTASAVWTLNRLKISVVERRPLSYLPYQGKWVALDEAGTILELVDSPAPGRLPVVSGVATNRALRGEHLTHPGLADALYVLSHMALPLRSQISEVHVAADRSLRLFTLGGATIDWGEVAEGKNREADVEQRLALLGEFWRKVPKQKAPTCRIDLRVAGLVIPSGCE